ncbi:MAG: spore coat protein [Clostridia bacterium]
MEEKIMVGDTLSSINTYFNLLNYSIIQCDDKNLRDYLVGVRNQFEALQWQVYEFAKEKQYYIPAAPAGEADIDIVRQECQAE